MNLHTLRRHPDYFSDLIFQLNRTKSEIEDRNTIFSELVLSNISSNPFNDGSYMELILDIPDSDFSESNKAKFSFVLVVKSKFRELSQAGRINVIANEKPFNGIYRPSSFSVSVSCEEQWINTKQNNLLLSGLVQQSLQKLTSSNDTYEQFYVSLGRIYTSLYEYKNTITEISSFTPFKGFN